jgi:hypothetical protein
VTKEVKLIKQLLKGEKVFMRATPSNTYNDPPDLISATWAIDFWVVDRNTPVFLPILSSLVSSLKPNLVTTKLEKNPETWPTTVKL